MSLPKLKETVERILKRLDAVENKGEEATKQALVLPVIEALGYDIWHPSEVCPEYEADFAIKKVGQKEKVDYAILINNVPRIYIEVKKYKTNLLNHQGQLSRYFNSTPTVSLAILTNGTEYQLFTDTEMHNIMDNEPFYIANFEQPDQGLDGLAVFQKTQFSEHTARNLATNLNYIKQLTAFFREQLHLSNNNPSDGLVRWVLANVNIFEGRLTTNTIDRFRPLIKQALHQVLQEMWRGWATTTGQKRAAANLSPINVNNYVAPLTEFINPVSQSKPAMATNPLAPALPTTAFTTPPNTAALENADTNNGNESSEALILDIESLEEVTTSAEPLSTTDTDATAAIAPPATANEITSASLVSNTPPLAFEIINQQFTESPLVHSKKLFDPNTQQELALELNWEQTPAYYSIYIYSPSWWIARFPLEETMSWVGFDVDANFVKGTIPENYEILDANNYARLRIKITAAADLASLNKLILTACQRVITGLRRSLKQASSSGPLA